MATSIVTKGGHDTAGDRMELEYFAKNGSHHVAAHLISWFDVCVKNN